MAAPTKLDAHHARVRDALILPFKRKFASLIIRTDIWKDVLDRKSTVADDHQDTRSRAVGAITEVDDQMTLLTDLKLPGEKKARDSEAEVKSLLEAFASMRLMLVGMAGVRAAA
jgi:hypothetical protein